MRLIKPGLLLTMSFFLCCICIKLPAQSIFTGINDSVINLPCSQTCANLNFKVPHLKSNENYSVVSIPYTPYPYKTATGNELTDLYDDDVYGAAIALPFPICFYGAVYNSVVVGSNGLLTFDISNASCENAYTVDPVIPYAGGLQCKQFDIYYPRAAIMGAYSDLDASNTASPADRKIEWRFEGVAPFRRFIASWYHVGVFGNTGCINITPTTFQIVVNEATSVIEVFFDQKICNDFSSGKAILGVQNWNRDQAVAAPGKNATLWTASKEGYRFIPSGATSRFVSSELLTLAEVPIETATTATTTPGLIDISFPTPVCPTGVSGQYIVRTIYSSCVDPTVQIIINDTITVNKSSLSATVTATQTDCGPGNGTITVTIPPGSGSSGPYTFVLNPGNISQTVPGTTATFNNLTAGNYSVTVTDITGICSSTVPATVTSTGVLPVTYTVSPPGCAGASNGSITVDPPMVAGPVLYTINGSPNPGNVFTNLAAGLYVININAGPGCTSTISVTVPAGTNVLTGTAVATGTSCSGVNNGSITATATNGTGPYTYSINNGATWQAGNLFNGLAPGNYTVLIREGGFCTSAGIPITVNTGAALSATTTTASTSCNGATDGTITVTPSNGAAPYQYSLDGGANQASNILNGVSSGNHSVVVRDATGCISAPIAVMVAAGAVLTGTTASTATACASATNGTITVTATNGVGPYQYALDGGANQAVNVFTNVSAGNHNAVITNTAGCSSPAIPVTVTAGSVLVATVSTTSTACMGVNNGSITVTTQNGSAPFQYSIDGGPYQASNLFTGISAGAHNVLAKDNFGCVSNNIIATIAAGTILTGNATAGSVSCSGATDGTISVTATNGSGPYQYSSDGGANQTSNIFTGVSSGPHNVVIRDNFGCISANIPVTVNAPAPLAATASVQNVLCNSQNNGVIAVVVAGGTAAYSYSLDNVTFQPANTFNVIAGTYTVYVKDANNCAAQVNNVNVTQPAVLTATAIAGNATCDGGNDGIITVTPAGGTSAYQYSSDGITFQSSNILKAGPGNYDATVKDANGCTFIIPGVIIGLTNNLTLTPAADPAPICEGDKVQLQLNTNATQFAWAPSAGLSNATMANPWASPAANTLYTVTATLGRCTITDDILVTVMPAPVPDAGQDGNICYGRKFQLQGSGGVTYAWTPASFLSNPAINNPEASPDKTITYTLHVTDTNGCPSLVPDRMVVNVTPPIKVTTFPADTIVLAGSKFQLLATSVGSNYTWSPATGLDNPDIPNPSVTAPAIDGSEVIYEVKVTTSALCEGKGYVKIQVYKGPDIYVPTAFTPNNDGKNDVFMPFPVGIKQLNYFRVFNRWGQLIYSTSVLNRGWDGKLGGIEQDSGVYVWMVGGITMDNKIINKKGTVTLIR